MTLRILLVDDDPAVLRSVARKLHRYDVDVTTAVTMLEAYTLLGERDFDVVITDRDTNEIVDGEDLARAIRDAWSVKMLRTKPEVFLHSARPERVDESLFDGIIPKGRIDVLLTALGLYTQCYRCDGMGYIDIGPIPETGTRTCWVCEGRGTKETP